MAKHIFDYLTATFEGHGTTADIGLMIDELDPWTVNDTAAVPLCNVCWAPAAVTADDAYLARAA